MQSRFQSHYGDTVVLWAGSPTFYRVEYKAQRGPQGGTALASFRVFERAGDTWTLVAAPSALAKLGQQARVAVNGPITYDLRFTITPA